MKKEMLINVLQPEECRIAIVEDGVLEELYVERTSLENYTGNIYKGRIVNIEPAIQAAFVDFSVGRNGFLHVSDVEPQYYRKLLADDAELGGRDRGRDPRRFQQESAGRGTSPPREPREPRESREPREDLRPNPAEGRARPPAPTPPHEPELPLTRPEAAGPAPEPLPEEPPPRKTGWGWGRGFRSERPDRSEKKRGDRPRRFGEGIMENLEGEAGTPPGARGEPTRSYRSWNSPGPAPAAPEPPQPPPRPPAVEPRHEVEPPAPHDLPPRSVQRPSEAEAYLPPSRTQRGRGPGGFARPAGPAADRYASEVPPANEPPQPARPGRGFARGLEPEPRTPEPPAPPAPPAPPESRDRDRVRPEPPGPRPEVDEADAPPRTYGSGSRRRGGRAAIRARGGDREPDRPRDNSEQHPRGLAAERPFEPPPPPTDWLATDEDVRAPEPRVLPEQDAPETSASDSDPNRPFRRAGERGYIPRRERMRDPFGDPQWDAPEGEPTDLPTAETRGTAPDLDPGTAEATGEYDPRDPHSQDRTGGRRRRHRRRRRDSDDAPEETTQAQRPPLSPLDDDLPPRRPARPRPEPKDDFGFDHFESSAVVSREIQDSFDFDEDQGTTEIDESLDEDEGFDLGPDLPGSPRVDDQIDPELEEEIRREIEEIAAIEREMGLRDWEHAEPRPRRAAPSAEPEGPSGPGRLRSRSTIKPPIQTIYKRGDEALVQVIKESIGTKGPTLSTYISIPGRYLVLMPGLNRVGVSRKIADEGQRRKLREIMHELNPPKGLGFIVRTAGLDRSKKELARDLAYLLRLWKVILKRIKKTKGPAPIYQESDMIIRTIRDVFSSDIDTIWIDEPHAFERAQDFMRVVMPKFVDRIKLYDEKVPLFHKYGIEEEIAKIQRRHVPLPEGGSIVIDQTEALVAIDVNSGNFRVEDDAEKTAYEMNLRAAKEIARQLRLRDLGGVIVNDFIDMREEKHRRGVERALREAVMRDRARTKILRMSQFGLVEMTRQRIRPSLKRSVYEDCSHCKGAGVVKTSESMAIDVMRLLALAANRQDVRRINLTVSSGVAIYLSNRKRVEIARLETEGNLTVLINHDPTAAVEHLQLECYDAGGGEIRILPPPTHAPHPRRR